MKGIDVSKHNGKIDWTKVNTDFVIIRAGYGINHIDERSVENIRGCESNGIPYGFYWFSYAESIAQVKNEAKYLCDFADKYAPTFPLCFDWEYDSDNHAKKAGVKISNSDRSLFASAFLEVVEQRGYYPMLYSNIDYLNKGFNSLLSRYDLWLASWGGSKPDISCGIWQYTEKGKVDGIAGYVDCNQSFKTYGKKNTPMNSTLDKKIENKIKNLEIVLDTYFTDKYKNVVREVYTGRWGNGSQRKKALTACGYDAELVQALINFIEKES